MDAVGAEPFGQRHAVVDDEGDVGIGADALQRLGKPGERVLVDVLDPELEGAATARLQRSLQAVREDARRRLAG